jgi:hypothetical protein
MIRKTRRTRIPRAKKALAFKRDAAFKADAQKAARRVMDVIEAEWKKPTTNRAAILDRAMRVVVRQ